MRRLDTVFFFFQAEDGIRDTSVTGVQTCALPISRTTCMVPWSVGEPTLQGTMQVVRVREQGAEVLEVTPARSEERRVGKGCRARPGRPAGTGAVQRARESRRAPRATPRAGGQPSS